VLKVLLPPSTDPSGFVCKQPTSASALATITAKTIWQRMYRKISRSAGRQAASPAESRSLSHDT
jgi:hypothetical protein